MLQDSVQELRPSSPAASSQRLLEELRTQLRDVPPEKLQQTLLELLDDLDAGLAEILLWDWEGIWARTSQLEPTGEWSTWLILAGRGYGKTRAGAEWAKKQLEEMPGCRLAIIARTAADARDTCVEGESGLLACYPPSERPEWNRSLGEGRCANGSTFKTFTSEKPDSLRGPQFHVLWADELAAWEKQRAAWEQVPYIVRLPWAADARRAGRVLITTTPKPVSEIRELVNDPNCVVTRGSTFDNWHNLNPITRAKAEKLRGTRMGRQELLAELLEDVPGALWTRKLLEETRAIPPIRLTARGEEEFDFVRVVVAVDPAVSTTEDSDETGIVGGARAANGHRFVLEDASGRYKPEEWAARAVDMYHRLQADCIVAEANNGGDLVESNIRAIDPNVKVRLVHASRGKHTRAEPISTAFERGNCHLVEVFTKLEDQLCTWTPDDPKSPDRLDAMVWLLTELEGGRVVL